MVSIPPPGPSLTGLLAGDVGHHVAYSLELLGFFIRDFDVKFFFECHDEFDGVERVGTEIFDEFGFGGHLIGIDAELIHNDVFYTGFDTFI